MNDEQRIGLLLKEAGPILDDAAIIQFDESERWLILLNDEIEIIAGHSQDSGMMTLTADVEFPHPQRRMEIYEWLLQFNVADEYGSGMRFGIDGPGGMVIQSLELPSDGLTATAFANAVLRFGKSLIAWRRVLASSPDETASTKEEVNEEETSPADALSTEELLRI